MQTCHEHSGVCKTVERLTISESEQWSEINKMKDKISGLDSKLNNKLNVLLVAAVVALLGAFIEAVSR
jgi:hypothetical protein